MNTNPPNRTALLVALILSLAGIFVAGWFIPAGYNWLIVAILTLLFTALVGYFLMGRTDGVLINNLNVMSLSRFQMVLWTVIVLSGYLTFVIIRVQTHAEDPLGIGIDKNLWILLGISTASLVGSPLLQIKKKDKTPKQSEVDDTAQLLQQPPKEVEDNRQGLLYSNTSPTDAQFSDMFQGDEVGNTAHVDLAKLQMFLFTLITAFSYCITLFQTIKAAGDDGTTLDTLPTLSEGMIALLGISHAGYLSSKAIDHTQLEKK